MKNLNRLLDLTKIVLNEIFDYLVSYFGVKKFKVDTVKDLVLVKDNKNNPQAILDTIDPVSYTHLTLPTKA